jgi:predicted SAM-dependent methyltransferase
MADDLKLNLGSRDRVIPGFKNMDLEANPGVEFVGDVSELSRFTDESVAEIFASNILEHFSHAKTVTVLKEWRRVLKAGGKLHISVPDFQRAIALYKRCGLADWIENFVTGDQGYPTAFHYAIFDEERLTQKLREVGFMEIKRVRTFDFAPENDCSNLASTLDLKPVCINMTAVK